MLQSSLQVAAGVVRILWAGARFAIVALLVIVEPALRFVLGCVALLLTLMAAFYVVVRPALHVPVGAMLGLALGAVLLIGAYSATIRILRT